MDVLLVQSFNFALKNEIITHSDDVTNEINTELSVAEEVLLNCIEHFYFSKQMIACLKNNSFYSRFFMFKLP